MNEDHMCTGLLAKEYKIHILHTKEIPPQFYKKTIVKHQLIFHHNKLTENNGSIKYYLTIK